MTEQKTRLTTKEFVAKHRIEISSRTPTSPELGWPRGTNAWNVTLMLPPTDEHDGGAMTVRFHMGPGLLGRKPEAREVLSCLADDAASIENEPDWTTWGRDMGLEGGKARRSYNAAYEQTQALRLFLGADIYNELVWETERE